MPKVPINLHPHETKPLPGVTLSPSNIPSIPELAQHSLFSAKVLMRHFTNIISTAFLSSRMEQSASLPCNQTSATRCYHGTRPYSGKASDWNGRGSSSIGDIPLAAVELHSRWRRERECTGGVWGNLYSWLGRSTPEACTHAHTSINARAWDLSCILFSDSSSNLAEY